MNLSELKLAFVSQPEYFRCFYESDLDQFFLSVREFKFTFAMTDNDFQNLLDYSPDITFFFRGEFFPDAVLRKLSGIKVNLSSEPFPNEINGKLNYTLDSLKRFEEFTKIANKNYDYVFHYDVSSLQFLAENGLFLSGSFPFPIATSVYKPLENIANNWDFFFIGRSTNHRDKYFNYLKHHYNFLHIAHGFFGQILVDFAAQSKILLNVHAEDEISWEPRVQMLLALKKAVISEKITPNNILESNTDYIEVSSPKEMYEATKLLLNDQELYNKISSNGYNKVQSRLKSSTNFPQLIKDIIDNKYPEFSTKLKYKKFYYKKILAFNKKLKKYI